MTHSPPGGQPTLWWQAVDGGTPPEPLGEGGPPRFPSDFSPRERVLAYTEEKEFGNPDIWLLPLDDPAHPRPFLSTPFRESGATFSPDGTWIAYVSNESGRNEVYVRPWPGPGPKIQISSEGGTDPIWSRNGKELFYRSGEKMMAVAVTTQPAFQPSKPQLLWEARYAHGMSSSCGPPGTTEGNYDVTTDGRRFLMIKDVHEDLVSTRIVVVLNFAEELKALAKAQQK